MKLLFPGGMLRRLHVLLFFVFIFGLMGIVGCSKSEVQLGAQPSQSLPVTLTEPTSAAKTTADRLVEIDRLLAVPLTGTPEESDRRAALRAERAALIASGQTPYRMPSQSVSMANSNSQPASAGTKRSANGNVVNYVAPTSRPESVVVAPNSQARNLSYLEQMTPTEREHYYKTLKLQNTQRVEIDVRRR
jgi:hypothetical protein